MTDPVASSRPSEGGTGSGWAAYYNAVSERPPRELLRHALSLFPSPAKTNRLAIDIGCGAGVETRELLRQGWNVFAIDSQPSALERVRRNLSAAEAGRLQVYAGCVEATELPGADFIWAGRSLPFLNPQAFPMVWNRIAEALKPAGRFAGDFFGVQDEWSDEAKMTFHTAAGLRSMFRPLRLEYFMSEQGLRPTATKGMKKSHAFAAIVYRDEPKRSVSSRRDRE